MARRTDREVTPPTEERHKVPSTRAKTSAAAALALVFGVSALVSWLVPPLAILFGVIALILGMAGASKANGYSVTGKGIAITGLILGVLGLLLGLGVIAGLAGFLLNEQNLQQIENQLQNLRNQIPTELAPAGGDLPG
jgi:Na+/melibiose symporter-like transporter